MAIGDIIFNLKEQKTLEIERLNSMKKLLTTFRKGALFVRSEKNNKYFYIKYFENGKTISKYIGKNISSSEVNNIKTELKNYKTTKKNISESEKAIQSLEKTINLYLRRYKNEYR